MDERKSNPWCTHNRAHRRWSHGVAEYIRTIVNRRPIYKFPFNLDLHTRSTFVRLHHKESWRRTEKIANKFSHAPLPRVTWPVAVVINSVVVLAFTNRRSIREENWLSVASEFVSSFWIHIDRNTTRALTFAA